MSTVMPALLLGLLLLSLGGCFRTREFVKALNEREVQSCIFIIGFPYPFVVVRSVTATGGMSVETCAALR